jgi:hypothetical protein
MTTTNTAAATATTEPKTASISLRANGSTMRLLAIRKADGTATTSVVVIDEKKQATRGMTAGHKDLAAAKAAISELASKAAKLGWARRPSGRGFVAQPDAFASLPVPPKAATKVAKAS